jgi:MFS family permease
MGSSRRVAWLLFAVAWGTNHFVPLLIVYRARLALSPVELAVLFGVYAVGLVPGLLLGGPQSDRLGRRAIVLPASIVALVGTCILAAGEMGFGVLLAGRFVVGLGAGATFSAGTAWVQDLAGGAAAGTGSRRAAVALSSGFGGGPLMTGVLAQWLPWPMQLPYAVHAAVLVTSIAGAGLSSAGERGVATRAPGSPGSTERRLESRDAIARPSDGRLPAGFVAVAAFAPWVFVLPSVSSAVLPALVRPKLGSFAVAFAGLVTGATLLTSVFVQPTLRSWRPSNANTFGFAMGVVGLFVAIVAAATVSPLAVVVAALFLGAGYGGCLIAGLRFIETRSTPATRGRLTGIFYTMTYLGFAWPLVLAAIARRVGDVAGLTFTWSLCLAMLVWSAWLSRTAAEAQDRRGG